LWPTMKQVFLAQKTLLPIGCANVEHRCVFFRFTNDIAKPVVALKTIPTSPFLAHQARSCGSLAFTLALFVHAENGATGAVLATFDDTIGELGREMSSMSHLFESGVLLGGVPVGSVGGRERSQGDTFHLLWLLLGGSSVILLLFRLSGKGDAWWFISCSCHTRGASSLHRSNIHTGHDE